MADLVYFRTVAGGSVSWNWMRRTKWDAMSDAKQTKHRDDLMTQLITTVPHEARGAGNVVVPAEEVPYDVRGRATATEETSR